MVRRIFLTVMVSAAIPWIATAAAPPSPASAVAKHWRYQNSRTVTELTGVFFRDLRHGWLVGGEHAGGGGGLNGLTVVRRTVNKGRTWLEDEGAMAAESLAKGHELKRVFALGKRVWIIGEQTDSSVTTDNGGTEPPCDFNTPSNTPSQQSIILFSEDGGETWTRQVSNTCFDLESIFMLDADYGLIGVTDGTYLRTSDGGRSWTSRTLAAAGVTDSNCQNLADSIYFPPSSNPPASREGWAADSCIFHTTDGGNTWEVQTVIDSSANQVTGTNWEQVQCASTTACLAVRNSGSTDNVAVYDASSGTWSTRSTNGTLQFGGGLLGLTMLTPKTAFVMGESPCCDESMAMFYSNDGGNTWTEVAPPGGSDQLYSGGAFVLDARHAWAVGQAGTLIALRLPRTPD